MTVVGTTQSNRTVTVKDGDGKTDIVKPAELKNVKKGAKAKEGNDLEITNQVDGASVGIKETREFVRAQIQDPDYSGPASNQEIMIRAIDFTSGGDNDD